MNLMSISAMKLPNPTALLHPSRIRPLASGIEVVVLSVGSMTTWQGTAVGGELLDCEAFGASTFRVGPWQ